MKLFIHLICIFLAIILQISLLPQITILGGFPNLILLVMLSLVFVGRINEAILWLSLGGILLEMVSPVHFGFYFFPLLAVFLLVNYLVKKLFTNPIWYLTLFFFFFSSLIFDLVWLFYDYSVFSISVLLADAIYNTILGLVIYYFMLYYYFPNEKIKI